MTGGVAAVARLETLLAAASPRPWQVFARDGQFDHRVEEMIARGMVAAVSDFLGFEIEGPDEPGRGQFARYTDAALIVEAINALPDLLAALAEARAVVAALTADDFTAWGSSTYEDFWQCHWCHAHGADINDEPRVEDHAEDCPWLRARALGAGEGEVRE